MKLSQEVKNYLNKEIIKETASGYDYRMIDGERRKINCGEAPEDCIVISNSSAAYCGRIYWKLWVKDPDNKYFDIYNIGANANLKDSWSMSLGYGYMSNKHIGTRYYSDKTTIEISYNAELDRIEGEKWSEPWTRVKQPIEKYDNDPSLRDRNLLSIRNFYDYQTTVSEKRPSIWASRANDNWSQREFSSEICQIIDDVYDLRKFKEAYPNSIKRPQDLIDFFKYDDKDLERRAKTRVNNENCIAEYRQAAEKFETTNTAVRIGNKIYFNYDHYVVYVQNLKTHTLASYTNWDSDIVKAATPKNGATYIESTNIFDKASCCGLFKGCFDANGKQISFAECFGKQSNVTTFFDYYDAPKRADVILNLFTIRGKYAKLLELAIKSKNKFLIQKIIERKVLEKEQYDKKSSWNKRNYLCFDGTKSNIPQMLNTTKYIVNQIKDLPVQRDIELIDAYVKLSTLFNNLSMKDFLEIYSAERHYSLTIDFETYENVFRLFAKDGLQTFKKRMSTYGGGLSRYKDYLNMRDQLQKLSTTDATIVFNSGEWPLFPEAAIKHVTLYAQRNYFGELPMSSIISTYTRYTLNNVEFNVLLNTKDQAILELNMDPVHHLFYLEKELTKIYNIYKDKVKNEAFKNSIERLKAYEFSDGQLSVVAPTQASDLTTEGSVLHHCVGSFIDAVANNKENVLFIRRNDLLNEPYYTMAISPSGNIEQIHCVYNGDLTAEGQERAYKATEREVYNQKFDLIKFLKQWVSAMKQKGVMINPNTIKLSYGALGAHN